jgi:uncharacterized protein (DUF1778 family)
MNNAKNKSVNIKTSLDDYNSISSMAQFHGQTISDFMLELVYEHMDDLEDIKAIRNYEKRKAQGKNNKLYTLDEIIKEHGLDV